MYTYLPLNNSKNSSLALVIGGKIPPFTVTTQQKETLHSLTGAAKSELSSGELNPGLSRTVTSDKRKY
jgi:hypothetical protein